MKTEPIQPARIAYTAEAQPPSAPAFGDIYHPAAGALAQARHVFLGGNDLPRRWRRRDRYTVFETGFGLGNNFLATWQAWRDDAERPQRLCFVSLEKHPPRRDDLARLHHRHEVPHLAAQLVAAWPPLTPNLHTLSFEGGRVTLLVGFGDITRLLPELSAEVDAFFLDGFAPAKNPDIWDCRVLKGLGRLAAPGATAATWSVARPVRDGLVEAGFRVERAPGFGSKREMTVARFEPRFQPPRLGAWQPAAGLERSAVIVGGGLAGCAAAHALALQGWQCSVLETHAHPAQETSGNPGGLFHGVVNPQDGAHARFNRTAALHAARAYAALRAGHDIAGQWDGLLRLESAPDGADAALAAMQATLDAQALPPEYVQAIAAADASRRSGLSLRLPAWYYPGGGWLRPSDLAKALLASAPGVTWRGGQRVAGLRHDADGWELLDADQQVLARAAVVVLANAHDAARLLRPTHWPISRVRGQTTSLPDTTPGLPHARLPVAGSGYLLPPHGGQVLCGATTQPGDDDASLREADHRYNLDQLARLCGAAPQVPLASLAGRVGWRCVSDDRLPVIGPVVDESALGAPRQRLDHARYVPRLPGLYLYTGLASRGITWALLGAEVLAAWISGAPCPVESDLRDAVDAARFVSRAVRRAS
ncbi:bifunctional tRNA (5-methylaminomethyl-2-thiouridine)(34)-methyltransferase MnmD/FAD-dependent 5-carboxymethylaminomethyl-2-thiouridine(34) oxidoreductase MnmC [Caldimonas brevitalea]|uniref:tRNA 5-methylaminomethyl-2-thiouridine biosynthesis bifunctional protein MnmC n=1 Tax=Caldimonas brevitalea TaxID=413882 RepID=A0A0G3BQA2_9BURK|nr:bifunctional tRNA (5-methylaminomethyl-2-thiouridine)(34)-methyltransferase MnmD/FAD-dependent 5-carboxymethylaminomethyl-2-thiouridine(34) oxidoreductase MnmC [Caldimonas brevitalea]AKJ28735.1 oxidoreductase [Caldimonas brevitalea]